MMLTFELALLAIVLTCAGYLMREEKRDADSAHLDRHLRASRYRRDDP